MFRTLIERFFRSEITHTEVVKTLNQQPEQISAILGAIFIVALKSTNQLIRLNIFSELSSATPLDVEKAYLIAAGLSEDITDSILFIILLMK
jgi:intein-encoded DNA endonuclease-like protein